MIAAEAEPTIEVDDGAITLNVAGDAGIFVAVDGVAICALHETCSKIEANEAEISTLKVAKSNAEYVRTPFASF